MPGLNIPLGGSLTDPLFPRLRQDALLTNGSLFLIDASHTAGGFGTGVPVDDQLIENIAWQEAAETIGAGSQNSMRATADIVTGTGLTMERSTKGGWHFILSQSGNLGAGVGVEVVMSAGLREYLTANTGHSYYLSAWTLVTRTANVAGTTWPPMGMVVQRNISATANYLAYADAANTFPGSASVRRIGARNSNGTNATGVSFRGIGAAGWTGSPPDPDAPSQMRPGLFIAGARGAYTPLAGTSACPSLILYRLYLEDLTVSGRTYAQVDALDFGLCQAAFAIGGKYRNDSFTAPA